MDRMIRGSITCRDKRFSHFKYVQTNSEGHPVSYSMGTRDSFPGMTQTVCEVGHPPASSIEVKNE